VSKSTTPDSFDNFGDLLKFLRRRSGLTQNELALAVGYHYTQLSKLEHNQRLPDAATLKARFIEALDLDNEPAWAARLLELAEAGRAGDSVALPLAANVPPAAARPLPTPVTPLIGRDSVVADLVAQLRTLNVRLLTLVGPSGIGKTRLSLQVAANLETELTDGAAFVDLSTVTDPARVPDAIANNLGVLESAGQAIGQTLRTYLHDKHLLLVLDNFEQVTAAASIVNELLTAAPRLKILVTSREVLNVYGERRYFVQPLPVPDLAQLPTTAEALTQFAALDLFCQRAQSVKPAFQLNESNVSAVAAVCARLDGLPLAIELAAARINRFTPQAMLTQLDNRQQWLTGGSRDLPARQQSLWGAVDWSYELLEPEEQRIFAMLSVFAGSFALVAAQTMGRIVSTLNSADLAVMVMSLADKSLLWQSEDDEGEPRFKMLETIRSYARQRLEADPELREQVLREHAAYYLAQAEAAAPFLRRTERTGILWQLEIEQDNLRAALNWLLLVGDSTGEAGPRLATALWQFWQAQGRLSEGRLWLEAAHALAVGAQRVLVSRYLGDACWNLGEFAQARQYLEESLALARTQEPVDSEALADALNQLGRLVKDMGLYTEAKQYLTEGLELARAKGDEAPLIHLLRNLGNVDVDLGQLPEARACFSESLAIARRLDDHVGIGGALNNLGLLALTELDYDAAEAYFNESLALFQQDGLHYGMALIYTNLGRVAHLRKHLTEARDYFEKSLTLARQLGRKWSIAYALSNLGLLACDEDDLAASEAYFHESLQVGLESLALPRILDTLGGLAQLRARQGQAQRAVELLGVVLTDSSSEQEAVDRAKPLMAELQSQISVADYDEALERGRALSGAQMAQAELGQSGGRVA
jgi:predicted ATPase/DNA-binding XRE family transcriptional regulator